MDNNSKYVVYKLVKTKYNKRIREHRRIFINDEVDSNHASHFSEDDHNFDDNVHLLHLKNKGPILGLLET